MLLIDTHSHLDLHHFAHDFQEVLDRSRAAGVAAQILPGVCQAWWPNLLKKCKDNPDLYAAIGLHPMYLGMHIPSHLDELHSHIRRGNLVALGEIGLDFYHNDSNRKEQQHLFETQLDLAKNAGLPILLHVRKAHDQVQAVLRRKQFSSGGIVHAYSGSKQQAMKYVDLGFCLSFGGTITYNRAIRIRSVAQALPVDAIVVETDAPDIPPVLHHGERNSPEYLPQIIETLALLRNVEVEEMAHQTCLNVLHLLTLENFTLIDG